MAPLGILGFSCPERVKGHRSNERMPIADDHDVETDPSRVESSLVADLMSFGCKAQLSDGSTFNHSAVH